MADPVAVDERIGGDRDRDRERQPERAQRHVAAEAADEHDPDGDTLKVSLYPTGAASFTDTEALNGGKAFALWDFVSEINAVVLFVTDGGNVSFAVLQRTNGRRFDLPAEPKVSPDRARIATADFCASNCENELTIWRVTKDGIQKELSWKPAQAWKDAGVEWKSASTVVVDYTPQSGASATLERRLGDAGWQRQDGP